MYATDCRTMKNVWKTLLSEMEFVPWSLTFIVSLFVGLEWGMMTGFIISVVYLLYYAAKPGVKVKKGYVRSHFITLLYYCTARPVFWFLKKEYTFTFLILILQTSCGNEFLLVELDRSITFPSLEYIKYVISKSSISWGKNKLPMVVDCELIYLLHVIVT